MPSTDLEQLLLELVNSARMDPLGDAARYISSYGTPARSADSNIDFALSFFFNVDGALLLQQLTALTPVQPVAWNENLATAARGHNQAMINTDTQAHTTAGELTLGPRLTAAGYNFVAGAENIYAYSYDPLYAHAGFMVDWGNGTGGMQTPAGHRINIMNAAYREVGIGITLESNPATTVGPQVVTQDFGSRGSSGVFVLGVAYNDADSNRFYSVGEGRTGLNVAVGAASTASTSSGGYTLSTTATGSQAITLSGGGLSGQVTMTAVLVDGMNIKLDVINGNTLNTSVSGTISGPVTTVQGLGLTGLSLTTGTGAQSIIGTAGADTLSGNAGDDQLTGGLGNDRLIGGDNNDTILAGDGDDVIVATHADGNDVITGGNGFDVLDYSAVNGVVQVNQLAGTTSGSAGNDTLLDVIEQVIGTNFDDVLSGGHGINILDGNGGNDSFFGNNGDDLMRGGDGDDTFYFSLNDGNDRLLGGPGFDILDYSSLGGVVQVNQLAGTTTGSANNDTLQDVFEMVIGTAFGDVLSGGHGINSLKGGGGNDTIFANGGDDYVSGGTGNDLITFGAGNDTIDFRNGEGTDTITDFVAGAGTEDTLTLKFYSGLGTTTLAGLQGAGRVAQVGADTQITLLGGDMVILQNVTASALHADDFIFV